MFGLIISFSTDEDTKLIPGKCITNNGCITSQVYSITEPDELLIGMVLSNSIDCYDGTGSIKLILLMIFYCEII